MKRALVFQHMDHDNPGRFAEYFAETGIVPTPVRLWEGEAIPSLAPYDFLMVLGGAMNVWQEAEHPWMVAEKEAIREWVAGRARPYLGLCLGHQLLADAFGGRVGPAVHDEIGVCDITVTDEGAAHPLFAGLSGGYRMMQWHSMEVKVPPAGAAVLATSLAIPVQAIAIGDCAVGLQFHAEFSAQTITDWRSLPGYVAAMERALGPGAYESMMLEAYPAMPSMARVARRIYDNLLREAKMA